MALLPKRNITRLVSAYEAVHLLGLVQTRPGDGPEEINRAVQSAMDSLARHHAEWGIVKGKRSDKPSSANVYTEDSIRAHVEACLQRGAA